MILSIRLDLSDLIHPIFVVIRVFLTPLRLAIHRLRHRGPDWSGCVVSGNHILCHERLAIVGVGESDL